MALIHVLRPMNNRNSQPVPMQSPSKQPTKPPPVHPVQPILPQTIIQQQVATIQPPQATQNSPANHEGRLRTTNLNRCSVVAETTNVTWYYDPITSLLDLDGLPLQRDFVINSRTIREVCRTLPNASPSTLPSVNSNIESKWRAKHFTNSDSVHVTEC